MPIATACSRDVSMVTDLWCVLAKISTPRLHSVRMAFNNRWEYRNADCCFNIDEWRWFLYVC